MMGVWVCNWVGGWVDGYLSSTHTHTHIRTHAHVPSLSGILAITQCPVTLHPASEKDASKSLASWGVFRLCDMGTPESIMAGSRVSQSW